MADRGTVDFHERNAQPIGNVLHQGRFSVSRRRNEQQQSHQVGAFVFSDDANLFRQVGSHHWQVRIVDQLVANKRRQHPRLEFFQTQFFSALDR